MADKPAPQTPPQTTTGRKNAPGAGRPTVNVPEDATPEQRALAEAQYALDRINAGLMDAPNTSYVAKVARCRRLGVLSEEAALRGLRDGVAAAMRDAEAAIKRLYAAPIAAPVAPKSRISLA